MKAAVTCVCVWASGEDPELLGVEVVWREKGKREDETRAKGGGEHESVAEVTEQLLGVCVRLTQCG